MFCVEGRNDRVPIHSGIVLPRNWPTPLILLISKSHEFLVKRILQVKCHAPSRRDSRRQSADARSNDGNSVSVASISAIGLAPVRPATSTL
jgi:hypothetical protein